MINKLLIIFFASILHFPAFSQANGNWYHEQCSGGASKSGQDICLGYVTGFAAGIRVQATVDEMSPIACIPPGVSNQQRVDVFTNYLRTNPENRHESASFLLAYALAKAFPCK